MLGNQMNEGYDSNHTAQGGSNLPLNTQIGERCHIVSANIVPYSLTHGDEDH